MISVELKFKSTKFGNSIFLNETRFKILVSMFRVLLGSFVLICNHTKYARNFDSMKMQHYSSLHIFKIKVKFAMSNILAQLKLFSLKFTTSFSRIKKLILFSRFTIMVIFFSLASAIVSALLEPI